MTGDSQRLSTSPVAAYTIKRVLDHKALVLSFQYLTSPTQNPQEPNLSPNYIMTQAQAIELAQKILSSAESLDT
jgi:hypothetical protein